MPPLFTVLEDTSPLMRVMVKDTDNSQIWAFGQPSFKALLDGKSTECITYDSFENQFEQKLNDLCSNSNVAKNCITVTKSLDPIVAPNGFIFNLYLNETMSNFTIHEDDGACSPFSRVLMGNLSYWRLFAKSQCHPFFLIGPNTIIRISQ